MHEPLSEQAERTLDRLVAEMRPTAAEEAQARRRLEASLAYATHGEPWRDRMAYTLRGAFAWMRRGWVALVILVLLGAAALQLVRGEVHIGRTYLEMAEDALGRGEPRAAHRLLVEHARNYDSAAAAEARIGLVREALCALGKPEEARRELERHLAVHPRSQHGPRLEDPCTRPGHALRDPDEAGRPVHPRVSLDPARTGRRGDRPD